MGESTCSIQLTRQAIPTLLSPEPSSELKPVLQCIDVKQIANAQQQTDRYRLVLSDGTTWVQAMLATQLNELVKNNDIKKGTIVRLVEFICNVVQSRRVIIVIQLEALGWREQVGNPTQFTASENPQPRPQPSVASGGYGNVNNHASDGHPDFAGGNGGNNRGGGGLQQGGMHGDRGGGGLPQGGINGDRGGGELQRGGMNGNRGGGGFQGNRSADHGGGGLQQGGMNGDRGGGGFQSDRRADHGGGGFQQGGMNSDRGGGGFQAQGDRYGANQHGQQGNSFQNEAGGGRGSGNANMVNTFSPQYNSNRPETTVRNEAPMKFVPIGQLNPYQNRWTILARCVSNGGVRNWQNAKGEGKVFSAELLDEHKQDIKCTGFNQIAEKYAPMFQVGRLYTVSKANLRPKRKDFNNTSCDYEIWLENNSEVLEYKGQSSIPEICFDFKLITDLSQVPFNTVVDVCGIVENAGTATTIVRKDSVETSKRSVTIVDTSNCTIEITLWGNTWDDVGQKLEQGGNPILACRRVRLGDFGGRSLSTVANSILKVNPDVPEVTHLRQWYANGGPQNKEALTTKNQGGSGQIATLSALKEDTSFFSQPVYLSVHATLVFVRHERVTYAGCPEMNGDRTCGKKLRVEQDDTYYCEKCQKACATPDHRYLVQMCAQDSTATTWLTCFDEGGETIFGCSANDMKRLQDSDDLKYRRVIDKANFQKYKFKLQVRADTYNDETRIKSTVLRADKCDFVEESQAGEPAFPPVRQPAGKNNSSGGGGNGNNPFGGGGGGNSSFGGGNNSFGGGGGGNSSFGGGNNSFGGGGGGNNSFGGGRGGGNNAFGGGGGGQNRSFNQGGGGFDGGGGFGGGGGFSGGGF